jgi:SAM-dependent methyltransferase
MSTLDLQQWFNGIDIYLFDQLLKGRITENLKVLDAGCGGGRNLTYFLRAGFDVTGVDSSPDAVAELRAMATRIAPDLPPERFRVEPVEYLSFPDCTFDVVISSAVLHFARDEAHWLSMVQQMWRVLKPGGLFFARLASTIGMENKIERIGERRYHLPDGTDRFLVDEQLLLSTTNALGGEWLEPLKTVVVNNMRSMSNWLLRKI